MSNENDYSADKVAQLANNLRKGVLMAIPMVCPNKEEAIETILCLVENLTTDAVSIMRADGVKPSAVLTAFVNNLNKCLEYDKVEERVKLMTITAANHPENLGG